MTIEKPPAPITLDYEIAKDLIDTKLRLLRNEVAMILDRWNEPSAEIMIRKARSGSLPEAEHDAIVLTNLLERINEFENLL
ncbi:MAG: hypothetical protein ACE5OZ_26055 [Candidatus Heimdallarchaeota archaeon]